MQILESVMIMSHAQKEKLTIPTKVTTNQSNKRSGDLASTSSENQTPQASQKTKKCPINIVHNFV